MQALPPPDLVERRDDRRLHHYTKLPLTLWFLAMSLLTQRKNAISALALKCHLGMSYATAWKVKHTLLQVMLERDADRQPSRVIEIDDVFRGGEVHGGIPERGSPDKTPFVVAVAKTDKGRPIALRTSVVEGFRKTELAAWAAKFVHPDSIVVSDGLACFRGIADAGIEPRAMVTGSGATGVELPERGWVNTILGNVKTAMKGTYHKAGPGICRATSRSSATGSIAASAWRPCCRASALRPRGPRPCLTARSSWLRLIGNQEEFCVASNRENMLAFRFFLPRSTTSEF